MERRRGARPSRRARHRGRRADAPLRRGPTPDPAAARVRARRPVAPDPARPPLRRRPHRIVPVLLACWPRRSCDRSPGTASSSTGTSSGRATTGASTSAGSAAGSAGTCSGSACAYRSAPSASRGSSSSGLPPRESTAGSPCSRGSSRASRPRPRCPAEPVVVFAGRHVPEKNPVAVVHAVAKARETIPDLRGAIYGDGPERPKVLAAIAEHGLEGVIEAPGFVDEAVIEDAARARALPRASPRGARATASSSSRRSRRGRRSCSSGARTTPRPSSSRRA